MNLIKQKLSSIGKNQSWLASEIGMSPTYINHLVCDRVLNPTVQTAFKIAKALGCRIEDLWSVNGTGNKERYI